MTKYSIGIDIGGTNTRLGIVTQDGNCIDKKSMRTDDYEDVNLFVNDVSDLISSLKYNLAGDSEIAGIGIGAPNGNFYKGTIEFAPNLKWKGIIPLADMLNKKTNLPAYLTNDANAGAIGEMQFGGAKNMKDFIFITLSFFDRKCQDARRCRTLANSPCIFKQPLFSIFCCNTFLTQLVSD